MDTEYQLGFEDSWFTIFKVDYNFRCEELALLTLESQWSIKRNRPIEDAIRDLYQIHLGKYDSTSNPLELLKLLLANNFKLRTGTNNRIKALDKSFFAITYAAKKKEVEVELGAYYRTSVCDSYDQFWDYCDWQDHLTGVQGLALHTMMELVYSGHQIIAKEQNGIRVVLGGK